MMQLRLLALSAVAVVASGAALAQDELSNWKTSAYLDVSYTKNWNHPFTGFNELRVYDRYDDSLMLQDLTVGLSRARGNGFPFGVTLELWGGRNVNTDSELDPGGDRWENLKQGYLSFGSDRWSFDLGKFNTWMGYETRDAIDNINNSRSMSFGFLQPRYHTGGRLWFDLGNGLDAGVYAVQGWNETRDSNDELSFGAHLGLKRNKWNARVNVYSGTEGGDRPSGFYGASSEVDVEAFEGMLWYNASDRFIFGIDATFLTADEAGTEYNLNGFALYGQYIWNDKWTLGARFEQVDDEDDFLFGTDEQVQGLTVNFDYNIHDNGKLRFEYRGDSADSDIFPSRSSFKDNQSTWSLSYQTRIK